MAVQGKNLPLEKDFYPDQGVMGKPHAFVNGSYEEKPYIHQEYPKAKYHADYVHDQKPTKEYGFNECAQIVNSKDEEDKLGPEWKDGPSMITAPSAQDVSRVKKEIGSSWRAAAALPETVTEYHVQFVQSQGMSHITNVIELYKFLGGLSSAQMNDFMKEAAAWTPKKSKATN